MEKRKKKSGRKQSSSSFRKKVHRRVLKLPLDFPSLCWWQVIIQYGVNLVSHLAAWEVAANQMILSLRRGVYSARWDVGAGSDPWIGVWQQPFFLTAAFVPVTKKSKESSWCTHISLLETEKVGGKEAVLHLHRRTLYIAYKRNAFYSCHGSMEKEMDRKRGCS